MNEELVSQGLSGVAAPHGDSACFKNIFHRTAMKSNMSVFNALNSRLYYQYLSEIRKPLHVRYQNLTDDQLVAIYAYTTDTAYNSFRQFNLQLRRGVIEKSKFAVITAINQAIAETAKDRRAESYYRFTRLSEADIKRLYPDGAIAVHNFFVSVSELKQNFISEKCNIVFTIIPDAVVKPAYIADISYYPEEEEYLYPPHSYFEVIDVERRPDGIIEILILEQPT